MKSTVLKMLLVFSALGIALQGTSYGQAGGPQQAVAYIGSLQASLNKANLTLQQNAEVSKLMAEYLVRDQQLMQAKVDALKTKVAATDTASPAAATAPAQMGKSMTLPGSQQPQGMAAPDAKTGITTTTQAMLEQKQMAMKYPFAEAMNNVRQFDQATQSTMSILNSQMSSGGFSPIQTTAAKDVAGSPDAAAIKTYQQKMQAAKNPQEMQMIDQQKKMQEQMELMSNIMKKLNATQQATIKNLK